jgi:hypothetical protein
MKEFDEISKEYTKQMQAANYHKAAIVGSIFISVLTLDFVGALKEGLVSFNEWMEPSWKKVSEMKCAPGGVVYHFEQNLN